MYPDVTYNMVGALVVSDNTLSFISIRPDGDDDGSGHLNHLVRMVFILMGHSHRVATVSIIPLTFIHVAFSSSCPHQRRNVKV